jgi:hypothetical protein
MELFSSHRYFLLYDYNVSHGELLIRSAKTQEHKKNIDVIFFGVKYIKLFVFLWGVSIINIDNSKLINFESELLDTHFSNDTGNIFMISSKGEKFYIVASYFKIYENDLNFGETSLGVLTNKGRENEIASS